MVNKYFALMLVSLVFAVDAAFDSEKLLNECNNACHGDCHIYPAAFCKWWCGVNCEAIIATESPSGRNQTSSSDDDASKKFPKPVEKDYLAYKKTGDDISAKFPVLRDKNDDSDDEKAGDDESLGKSPKKKHSDDKKAGDDASRKSLKKDNSDNKKARDDKLGKPSKKDHSDDKNDASRKPSKKDHSDYKKVEDDASEKPSKKYHSNYKKEVDGSGKPSTKDYSNYKKEDDASKKFSLPTETGPLGL
ncbi:hmu, partial [Mucuna pruriens]